MATTHQYLIFQIHLSDLAQVTALQAGTIPGETLPGGATIIGNGVGAILAAPDAAAVKYAAPIVADQHSPINPPCISSAWFGTQDHFPTNVPNFDRKSGGWFGIPFLFGDTTHYHWRGTFNYVPPPSPPGVPIPPVISTRRWIDGFEIADIGEGGTGAITGYSRGASRHTEGWGYEIQGTSTSRTHTTTENGGALPTGSWERFYVRLKQKPAAPISFWRENTNISAAIGFQLQVLPSGQLALAFSDAVSTLTTLGSAASALPMNKWVRIDLNFLHTDTVGSTPASSKMDLYINGVNALSASTPTGANLTRHASSLMGGAGANTLGLDVDDWMNADYQTHAAANDQAPDWANGSAIKLIRPTGFDGSMASWVGDYRVGLMNPARVPPTSAALTSSTAAAPLVMTTDALDVISNTEESLGVVAILISLRATTVQTANLLGLVAADLTGTLTGTGVVGAGSILTFLWKLVGATVAIKPTNAVKLSFNHGNAGLTTVTHFLAAAEIIGIFGPEDIPPSVTAHALPPSLGIHNAPYPRTPWARQTTTPIQPVFVRAGTYVGNGTGQDLLFPVPIHFMWVRPLSGDAGGARWWTSMLASHKSTEQQQVPAIVNAKIDPNFVPAGQDTQQQQTIVSIVGADAQSNANGVTYAYLAFGDPGMRFLLNGALGFHSGTVGENTPLAHAGFTPLAGFVLLDKIGGGSTIGLYYKGPGHAAASISLNGSADLANALTFGLANIATQSAFTSGNSSDSIPFALWRQDDFGATDSGKAVQIFSYVGDGSASRTLSFRPVIGKRPLWALILKHSDGTMYVRDPQHTTVNSQQVPSTNITTAITGGDIDSIIIGTTLNTNGVVFDVFCIPGDSTAGNGGWSIAGDFFPVPPDPPPGAPGDLTSPQEPPDAPVSDPIVPSPGGLTDPIAPVGPMPGLIDDLDAACVADTARIVNVALSRLGISQQVANISTDVTAEAVAVRLNYTDAVQATLRDFPWPFATRYVQLAVVATTPNSDWAFSYRQPTDCLFERRLVVSRTGAVDPEPPAFQLATDDTGGLIFTNVANAVLEYTARPKCPHTRSEPLFRDAVSWKLAAAMAPALSRLTDAAINCTKMYWATIEQARQVLRPNNPGAVAAAATVDVSAAAQAANLAVANRALVRIGARTIRNLSTDQSREAQTVRLVFEPDLVATLRDLPWPFATRYATLVVVSGPAPPANADWQYSYRRPADCVFERRFVVDRAGAVDPAPPPFQLSSDATGGLIFANVANAVLEYTARPEGAVLFANALFQDALAWKLAGSIAPSLAPVRPQNAEQVGRGPEGIEAKSQVVPSPGEHARLTDLVPYAQRMYDAAIATARHVIEQGAPGALPSVPTIDTATPAQAANVSVVNLALVRIGARTIRDLSSDQSREAQTARLIFERELRTVLRDFPWAFATSYVTPALVGGTSSAAVNADWQYSYRLPADLIFARRLVTSARRAYERNPPPFKLAQDATGGLLYTDQVTPVLEYTARVDAAVQVSDALFQDAFAWKLAATLAPALALAMPELPEQIGRGPEDPKFPKDRPSTGNQLRARAAEAAFQMYHLALAKARATAANEAEPDVDQGDADWIAGR